MYNLEGQVGASGRLRAPSATVGKNGKQLGTNCVTALMERLTALMFS